MFFFCIASAKFMGSDTGNKYIIKKLMMVPLDCEGNNGVKCFYLLLPNQAVCNSPLCTYHLRHTSYSTGITGAVYLSVLY